jgi:hypothetical protein
MKYKFKVYAPWDSLIVEAKDEADAKAKALQQIIWEAQDASPDHLDAEKIGLIDEDLD